MAQAFFDVRPLGETHPGVEIDGLDVRGIGEDKLSALKHVLAVHGVAVVRNQTLAPAELVALGRHFGEIEPATRERYRLPEQPELYVISNIVVDGKPLGNPQDDLLWHTDQYYLEHPTAYTFLYAIETPPEGADTLFCSTRRAYDDLSDAERARYESIRIKASHRELFAGGLTEDEIERYPDVIHPLVRTHPITEQKALYFALSKVARPLGMSDEEGRSLMADLGRRTIRPEATYAHKWRPKDLLMWDNRALLHTATPYDKERYRRLIYRVSVSGERPC